LLCFVAPEYFTKILSNSNEDESFRKTERLFLAELSKEAFDRLVRFWYGEAVTTSLGKLGELASVLSMCQMHATLSALENNLIEVLSPETCLQMLSWDCINISLPCLDEKAEKMAGNHFFHISTHAWFNKIRHKSLLELLRGNNIRKWA